MVAGDGGVAASFYIGVGGVFPIIVAVDGDAGDPWAAGDEAGGAVAVMEIHIKDGGVLDEALVAEGFEGDDEAIKGAEALAVRRGGVVESAGEAGGGAAGGKGAAGGSGEATAGELDGGKKTGGPSEFLGLSEWAWFARLDGADVFGRVDAGEGFASGG